MISVSFDPVYLEIGAPALAIGILLVIGVGLFWLERKTIRS